MSAGTSAVRTGRARIGRRPIHDRVASVVGYELFFHIGVGQPDADPADHAASDQAASALIVDAFSEFGLARLGPKRHLYLNVTRSMCLSDVPMPFGPQNVVLEVTEDLEVDRAVIAGLEDLKERGYRLALEGHLSDPDQADLLALVSVIKLDVGGASGSAELTELAEKVRQASPQAALMAESVDSAKLFQSALAAGFDLFQGSQFHPPATPGAEVKPSQAIGLQLLAALSDLDTPLPQVLRIVSADPGLSLRILGSVNSAAGAGRQITSLSQAIVLMGRRSLSAWVMQAVLGGDPNSRSQDMIDMLTRARTCELLAADFPNVDPSAAYLMGLLSGMAAVMGADPSRLARSAGLDSAMTAALVDQSGPIGALLVGVEQFEQTAQTTPAFPPGAVSRAHLHALGIAIDTIDSVLGQPI